MGIRTAKITSKTGKIVSARIVKHTDDRDLLVISKGGQVIRLAVKTISSLGRATQGVRVMRFKKADDQVSSVALVENTSEVEIVEDSPSPDKSGSAGQGPEEKKEKKKAKAPAKKKVVKKVVKKPAAKKKPAKRKTKKK